MDDVKKRKGCIYFIRPKKRNDCCFILCSMKIKGKKRNGCITAELSGERKQK
jgi:hypothetical protein